MFFGNTIKFAQVALGLVPEVLDAVDVVFTGGKQFGVIDPQMPEASHSERVVAGQRVTINDGVGHNSFFQNRQQRRRLLSRSSPRDSL